MCRSNYPQECFTCGEIIYEGENSSFMDESWHGEAECGLCRVKYMWSQMTDYEKAAMQYFMEKEMKRENQYR